MSATRAVLGPAAGLRAYGLLLFSLASAACGDDTAIAAKAIVVVDNQAYVIDTGDDGRNPVQFDGETWNASCLGDRELLGISLFNYANDKNGLYFMQAQVVVDPNSDLQTRLTIEARVNDESYLGGCPLTYKGSTKKPYEGDITADGPCSLDDGKPNLSARLEMARFRVIACD